MGRWNLATVIKNYEKADMEVFCSCQIMIDWFIFGLVLCLTLPVKTVFSQNLSELPSDFIVSAFFIISKPFFGV